MANVTKPIALDETLQDTNDILATLGKDTSLQAIATALATLGLSTVGNLSQLTTEQKTSLVAAINEINNVTDISSKIVMTDPDRQQNVKAYQYGKVIFISLYTGKVTSANTNITIGSIDSSIRAGVNVPGNLGLASAGDFGYGSINIGASGSIVLIYSKTTSYNLYATFTYVIP